MLTLAILGFLSIIGFTNVMRQPMYCDLKEDHRSKDRNDSDGQRMGATTTQDSDALQQDFCERFSV